MSSSHNPTRSILASGEPSPFTLMPSQFGGRKARKGFAFQDWWIAYKLVGLLADRQPFFFARIEAVEDLDLVLPQVEDSVEQYYQLKSMQEGSGSWTLNRLEKEGVVTRFAELFVAFDEVPHDTKRQLKLVAVLEGDISKDLLELRSRTRTAGRLQVIIALAIAAALRVLPQLKPYRDDVETYFRSFGDSFSFDIPNDRTEGALGHVAARLQADRRIVGDSLRQAGRSAVERLERFMQAFQIESRAPGPPGDSSRLIEEAIIARLVQIADVTPNEAQQAALGLVKHIEHESALTFPTKVDKGVLLSWLGLKPKIDLQLRPAIVPDYVDTDQFLTQAVNILKSEGALCIYGITRIGKSQLASRLIERAYSDNDYFWFTFTQSGSDRERLVRELATWLGKRYGLWQLLDDCGTLSPEDPRFWKRATESVRHPALFVLDDFHKGQNLPVVRAFKSAVDGSGLARLLVLSEPRLSFLEAFNVEQLSAPGLDPRETMLFVSKQGIDATAAMIDVLTMSIQFGGHPLMLKAVCQLLPSRPTGADIRKAIENLPSVGSISAFLTDLSNKVFFTILCTPEQRRMTSGLSVLTAHCDKRVAFAMAAVAPPVTLTSADWTLLSSCVLDAAGPDRYVLPPILKHLAEDNLEVNVPRSQLLVAAARTFLTPKTPTQELDFIDFQAAIFSFIAAKKNQAAAHVLANAIPTLLSIADYGLLQPFFMVLNAPLMHETFKRDKMLRWRLLMGEVLFRWKDRTAAKGEEATLLLKRMRSIAAEEVKGKWFLNVTILSVAASLRGLRIDRESPPPNSPAKLIAPVLTALRIALKNGARDQITSLGKFVGSVMRWGPFASSSVLTRVAPLLEHIVAAGFPPNRVVELFMRVPFSPASGGSQHKRMLLEHAAQFESNGFLYGYIAAMYAVAHIEHEYEGNYLAARAIAEDLLRRLSKLRKRHALVARMRMLVGDTYWRERNYEQCANNYSVALEGHNVKIVRESAQLRMLDCSIELGQFTESTSRALGVLRRCHRWLKPNAKSQLYARLAYGFAKKGELLEAAIACAALDRTGQQSQMDDVRRLSLVMAAWTLQHFDFDDRSLPKLARIQFESNAISDTPTEDQLRQWRENDPTATKARLQIAVMFELLRHYKRAYALVRDSLSAGQGHPDSSAYIYILDVRAIRLLILMSKYKDAARAFHQLLGKHIPGTPARDVAAYGIWYLVEPIFVHLSDQQIVSVSDELFAAVSKWPDAQASIRFQESHILFDRFLVQKAKHCLAEAESLARQSEAEVTLCSVLKDKLFFRVQQTHRGWGAWAIGLAEALLDLRRGFVSDQNRRDFATATRVFLEQNPNRFHRLLCEMDQKHEKKSFSNIARALVQFASETGVSDRALDELSQMAASEQSD